MSTIQPFGLQVGDGRELLGIIHAPDQPGPRPTVVVCHGFKGFMDWGFFPFLAELLAERGFAVVRFNFTGSGMRPGDELVTDTEAFRRATFSQDLRDLERVLSSMGTEIGEGCVDPERIGLFGHSRGGGIATLVAAQEAWRKRLRALVTWAAVSTFDRLTLDEKELWLQPRAPEPGEVVIDAAKLSEGEHRLTVSAVGNRGALGTQYVYIRADD